MKHTPKLKFVLLILNYEGISTYVRDILYIPNMDRARKTIQI